MASRGSVAVALGLVGFPLWALSYAWVPFRAMEPEPAWVWPAVVVGEVGAVVTAVAAIVLGLRARRDAVDDAAERRRATTALRLGIVVLVLVVGLNVVLVAL